jgi:hypothetical protein
LLKKNEIPEDQLGTQKYINMLAKTLEDEVNSTDAEPSNYATSSNNRTWIVSSNL